MKTGKEIVVLCAGGHARVLVDILRRSGQTVIALIDNDSSLRGTKLDGVPITGDDKSVFERDPNSVVLVNALGNAPKFGDSMLRPRREIFDAFSSKGYSFLKVCSPDAVVSGHVDLGDGCQVISGVIINPGCSVGANSIVNTGAQLDHDCEVGHHSHIGPGAVLCGAVRIGDSCHVGTGAVVTQGVCIGADAVVGAGAVVVKNVSPGATVLGNPAKVVSV
jgi:sugar O-acyltransferase (sialic acid O-acetyltransferase NeuD family)